MLYIGGKKEFYLHMKSIDYNPGQWNKQANSDVSLIKSRSFHSKKENQDFRINLKN